MHAYRTHTCGELRRAHQGRTARLSGWIHRKRDHGNLLFIDLRDRFGITQCVIESDGASFAAAEAARLETVVTVTGPVVPRGAETVNPDLPTGEVELSITDFTVQASAETLPLEVNSERDYGEEVRLKYRFLTCVGRRCSATSCCVARWSSRSGAGWSKPASPSSRRRS